MCAVKYPEEWARVLISSLSKCSKDEVIKKGYFQWEVMDLELRLLTPILSSLHRQFYVTPLLFFIIINSIQLLLKRDIGYVVNKIYRAMSAWIFPSRVILRSCTVRKPACAL